MRSAMAGSYCHTRSLNHFVMTYLTPLRTFIP